MTIESPLKMMKIFFHFMLKAFFILKILTFLSWLFGDIGKRFDQKAKINFKIYYATGWAASNNNTKFSQYLKSKGNQAMKFGQLIEDNGINIFLQKPCRKWDRKTSSREIFLFFKIALYKIKASGQHSSFNLFWLTPTGKCNKNKLYNISDFWSRDMLNFNFL